MKSPSTMASLANDPIMEREPFTSSGGFNVDIANRHLKDEGIKHHQWLNPSHWQPLLFASHSSRILIYSNLYISADSMRAPPEDTGTYMQRAGADIDGDPLQLISSSPLIIRHGRLAQ